MYSRVRVRRTLEYVMPGCGVYSRVRPTRMWRTLEYVLSGCGVAYYRVRHDQGRMYSRVQKLPIESVAAPTRPCLAVHNMLIVTAELIAMLSHKKHLSAK